ncbi:hypothetical protein KL936_001358 [Ogataea polymorpha]|nr:hypothetical protein KL936_001358 [Ogataea polymorpha]
MPRFKGSNSKTPEEFWKLQPTLVKFEEKMKRSESKIAKMGRPKHESLWEISQINHQRSRYIYEMFYKKKLITRPTYDWLLNHKYGDAELIAKWRKQGYENLPRQKRDKLEGPKRDAILDLQKYQNQRLVITFLGGRKVNGVLKGFDQLMNLVLDNCVETLKEDCDSHTLSSQTRHLGLVVVRGPVLLTISPFEGSEVIENPYQTQNKVMH